MAMDRKAARKTRFLALPDVVIVARARAIADFKASEPHILSFRQGDILDILDQKEAWWQARLHGMRGFVPSNYMQIITEESDDDSHSRGSGSIGTVGDITLAGSVCTQDCELDSIPSEMKDSISITFPGNKAVKRVSNEPFARSIAKVARAMKRIFVPDTKVRGSPVYLNLVRSSNTSENELIIYTDQSQPHRAIFSEHSRHSLHV